MPTAMPSSQEIHTLRTILRSLMREHEVSFRVSPFDDKLYQECVDEAVRRGYPMDDGHSLKRYLPHGVIYAATATRHYIHRPSQVWMALYTAAGSYVDDVISRSPSEIPNIYLFNDRFTKREQQGNADLDAFADITRQAADLFRPILSNLIITATLDFVTSNLLDHETASMKFSSAARRYPFYLRTLSGFPEPFAFMAFPPEIPLTVYVQALPEVMQLQCELNDVLSFYKEEIAGDNANHISLMAAQNKESKLESLKRVVESVKDLYKTVMEILEGSPEACDAFRQSVVGFYEFHFAAERYKLVELDL